MAESPYSAWLDSDGSVNWAPALAGGTGRPGRRRRHAPAASARRRTGASTTRTARRPRRPTRPPVRRGDPGYGRHLDRDGVACE
ncbi:excalibur calcium-binding domain-containing protein [Streptomyces virginiae]|uniref:excalibur calcium-binding domain-containing protein n=1 Tax=Streptomyces virginiae TaxID=1961 RepID=UPI0036B00FB7